jgi:dihydrofolate reductase
VPTGRSRDVFRASRAVATFWKRLISLMNSGLLDEIQLLVNPVILSGGKALFKDVKDRHALKLVQAKPFKSGKRSI